MQFIVQGYPAYAYTGGVAFDAKRPAVVMVHGAAMDHSVWQWQSRYLAHHGYAVLAVDLPAHGRSPGMARERVEDLGSWMVGLLDAGGIERAALVGHSMGALASLAATLAAPQRVTRLALLGASAPMPVGDAFLSAAREAPPVAFDMEAVWSHVRNSQLASSAVPGATLLGATRALNDRSRAGVLATDLAACNAYRPDEAALKALTVPALVVSGKRDVMTPPRAGKALAAAIPGAKLVTVDAGHSMMVEAPRQTLGALRDFLAA
jgi:pimeloyl-ACP methyl ester carboxylesterase